MRPSHPSKGTHGRRVRRGLPRPGPCSPSPFSLCALPVCRCPTHRCALFSPPLGIWRFFSFFSAFLPQRGLAFILKKVYNDVKMSGHLYLIPHPQRDALLAVGSSGRQRRHLSFDAPPLFSPFFRRRVLRMGPGGLFFRPFDLAVCGKGAPQFQRKTAPGFRADARNPDVLPDVLPDVQAEKAPDFVRIMHKIGRLFCREAEKPIRIARAGHCASHGRCAGFPPRGRRTLPAVLGAAG